MPRCEFHPQQKELPRSFATNKLLICAAQEEVIRETIAVIIDELVGPTGQLPP